MIYTLRSSSGCRPNSFSLAFLFLRTNCFILLFSRRLYSSARYSVDKTVLVLKKWPRVLPAQFMTYRNWFSTRFTRKPTWKSFPTNLLGVCKHVTTNAWLARFCYLKRGVRSMLIFVQTLTTSLFQIWHGMKLRAEFLDLPLNKFIPRVFYLSKLREIWSDFCFRYSCVLFDRVVDFCHL